MKYIKPINAPQMHEIEAINKIKFAKIHADYEYPMKIFINNLKAKLNTKNLKKY